MVWPDWLVGPEAPFGGWGDFKEPTDPSRTGSGISDRRTERSLFSLFLRFGWFATIVSNWSDIVQLCHTASGALSLILVRPQRRWRLAMGGLAPKNRGGREWAGSGPATSGSVSFSSWGRMPKGSHPEFPGDLPVPLLRLIFPIVPFFMICRSRSKSAGGVLCDPSAANMRLRVT